MRRYKIGYVSTQCNVSSSGHYFAQIVVTDHGKTVRRDYCIGSGFLALTKYNAGDWKAPQYLERAAREELGKLMTSGVMEYFEYDRDGNERRENLRYYDPQQAASWAEWLLSKT